MPESVAYFPALLDDELLYSAIARLQRDAAHADPVAVKKRLFGTVSIPTVLPGNLNRLLGCLPHAASTLSFDRLVQQHTIYPYFAPFLSTDCAARTLDRMGDEDGLTVKLGLGVIGSKLKDVRYLRFCLHCLYEQQQAGHDPYWRRCHQLPGPALCHRHGDGLIDRCVHCGPFDHRRTWMPLPRLACPNCGVHYSVPASAARLREDARHPTFAKMSAELLLANIPTPPTRVLVAEYAAALDGIGLKPKSSTVRGPISAKVREHWGDAVLSELGLLDKKSFAMPRNVLHGVEATTHPVFHLLLIGVLFGSIGAFATQLRLGRSRSCGQTRGDDAVALLEAHQRDVFAASTFSHVPVWSLARAALTQHIFVGRYYGKRDPRLTRLIECGLAEGAQISEIAAIAAVSVETVYRRLKASAETAANRALRLREVDLQERRETFLKWYRGPNRSTQGNSKYTYRALYHWLYYNDRAWLDRALGRANG